MGQFAIWDLRVEHQGVRRLRTCILAVVFDDVVEAAVDQCQITLKTHTGVTTEGIKKLDKAIKQFPVTRTQIERL